jgi:hypothetical protein
MISSGNPTIAYFPPPNHPLDSAHPTDEGEDDDDDNNVPKTLNQDGFLVDNTEHKTILVDDNGFIVPPTAEELTHIYERVTEHIFHHMDLIHHPLQKRGVLVMKFFIALDPF